MQENAQYKESKELLFVEGIGDEEYLELLRDGIELTADICMLYASRNMVKPCYYNVGQYTAQMGRRGRGEK